MKRLLTAVVAITTLAVSGAAAQTVLKFGHPAPETDLTHKMALMFAEKVEEGTNGEIVIKVFPNGQLGNDEQLIDGVRSGIIHFELSGLNNFTGMVPEAGAFTLPFMFPTREQAYTVLDGDVGKGVLADLEEFGLKGLGFPENGYRNITTNKGPVRVPADLAGVQMRVNNSQALYELFASLDANPQQISVKELYTALETGVVDAQDHPLWVVEAFKFYEVQEYLSLSRHSYSALVLVMNLDTFKSLSPEHQQVVLEAAAEAIAFQRRENAAKEEATIEFLISQGMKVNRDVDGAAFQEAAKPIWAGFIEQHGEAMIDRILAATQ